MKNMPLVGVIFGVILILIGVGGYLGSEVKSLTAFIPSAFGLLLVISSAVSFNEID